jgi:hypothetical protein
MLSWNAITLFDHFTNLIALRGGLSPLGQRLLPAVVTDGREFGVLMPGLAAVSARELTNLIANVEQCRDRIVAALDQLFLGI